MRPSTHIKQSYSLLDFNLHTQLLYLMLQAKLRYRYFHLSFSAHPHKSIHPRSIFHGRAIRLFWFERNRQFTPLCVPLSFTLWASIQCHQLWKLLHRFNHFQVVSLATFPDSNWFAFHNKCFHSANVDIKFNITYTALRTAPDSPSQPSYLGYIELFDGLILPPTRCQYLILLQPTGLWQARSLEVVGQPVSRQEVVLFVQCITFPYLLQTLTC